jgi:hypothetical protein
VKPIDKLIQSIDARFVSGNEVAVSDARISREEWSLLRLAACAAKHDRWEPTEQGRAYLGGSSRG